MMIAVEDVMTWSIENHHLDIVKYLVYSGSYDLNNYYAREVQNATDANDNDILDYFLTEGSYNQNTMTEAFKFLIEARNDQAFKKNLDAIYLPPVTGEGVHLNNLLVYAAGKGTRAMVENLVKTGADINACQTQATNAAIENKNLEALEYLYRQLFLRGQLT